MNDQETITHARKYTRKLVRQFGFLKSKYANTEATYGETHALIELERLSELEVGELARLLNIDKPQASKLLKAMEKKRWVRSHAVSDARKKVFGLTPSGIRVFKKVDLIAHTRIEDALGCLSKEKVDVVLEGVQLLSDALERSAAAKQFVVRRCTPDDNAAIAGIVRNSLKQFDMLRPGTVATDPSLNSLSSFNTTRQCYFVAVKEGRVFGGAGIAELAGEKDSYCELIRMFIHPEARSLGVAQILLAECLTFAKSSGYKTCYLETAEKMQAAQRLYLRNGFRYTEKRRGNTGHFLCQVVMEKEL